MTMLQAANALESRNRTDDEKIETLEDQLKVAKANAEESDAKYNEVMRKMTMLQAELEKAEDRAKDKESKNAQLEEELKEFGYNVNTLKNQESKIGEGRR